MPPPNDSFGLCSEILENFAPLGRGCVNLNRLGRVSGAKCLGGGLSRTGTGPQAGLTELTKGVLAGFSRGLVRVGVIAKLDKQSDELLPTMLDGPSRRSSAYRVHSGCTEEYCLIITRPKFQLSH